MENLNESTIAPIVLFTYNRLLHTRKTIEALKKNELANVSELFIFSDGPKMHDAEKVEEVRKYLRSIDGFLNIHIEERKTNFGLSQNIISGISKIVGQYGKVIVLEDDIETSPFFLRYMNDALDLYENENNVASIHGYMYPVMAELPETFFLKGADCWGWATWDRAWKYFNPNGQYLYDELISKNLVYEFDYYGNYKFSKMLKDQIIGKNDSWAIRWHASAFLNDLYTLHTRKSLVKNIGLDNSGVHCANNTFLDTEIFSARINLKKINIIEDVEIRKKINHFLGSNKTTWKQFFPKMAYNIWKLLKR